MTIGKASQLSKFEIKPAVTSNSLSPTINEQANIPNTNNLLGKTSQQGEYNFAGLMRQTAFFAKEKQPIPTPVAVPEAEEPTPEPTSTVEPTTSPTQPAATLNLEETKSISDIAYDGEVGEVYQLPDGSYWQIDQVETDDSGFRAVVTRQVIPNPDGSGTYVDDPADSRVVVGFAGTNAGDDINDDILQGVGLTPAQYDQALAFTEKVQQEAAESGESVVLTGHSLGGGLATYSSIQTGLPATAINSAPLDNGKVPNDTSYDDQITQYYSEGEILTDLDNGNPFDSRPGEHIKVTARYEEESFSDGFDWRDPIGSTIENRAQNIKVSVKNHQLDNTAPEVAAPIRVYP